MILPSSKLSTAILCTVILLTLITLPGVVFAGDEGFVPLVGLPGIEANQINLETYLNTLIQISIIAGAFIAVFKLIYAGAQYILSGLVTTKAEAKKEIQSAIVGLLIIILAVTILREINPKILNLGVLPNAPSYDEQQPRQFDKKLCSHTAQGQSLQVNCSNVVQECAESCSDPKKCVQEVVSGNKIASLVSIVCKIPKEDDTVVESADDCEPIDDGYASCPCGTEIQYDAVGGATCI